MTLLPEPRAYNRREFNQQHLEIYTKLKHLRWRQRTMVGSLLGQISKRMGWQVVNHIFMASSKNLFLVTCWISPSTCVACPLAAFGGSIRPWFQSCHIKMSDHFVINVPLQFGKCKQAFVCRSCSLFSFTKHAILHNYIGLVTVISYNFSTTIDIESWRVLYDRAKTILLC